jgi:hypothetical protein
MDDRVAAASDRHAGQQFIVVLRRMVAREREAGGWSSRDALGIGADRDATPLIHETLANVLPAGFDMLEGDRRASFRLRRDVIVEAIHRDALAAHTDACVQRVAVERRNRLGARKTRRDGVGMRDAW